MERSKLIRHIGNMEQLASVRSYTVTQGPMDGIRMHHMDAGLLTLTAMESRGLDILDMRYKGIPLNFLSKCGAMERRHVDPIGGNFLRSISGGMLYTCGLNNVGNQVESENGIDYFHGRMRLLPADKVRVEQDWDEMGYRLAVSGQMRQAGLFRENMLLKRTIECHMDSKTVTIYNEVVNEGITEEPLMLMFHVNVGYPILCEGCQVEIPTAKVWAMSPRARELPEDWKFITEPVDGEQETVYVHQMRFDDEGMTHAMAYNPELGLGLGLSYPVETMPKLLQWRSMGSTDYVLGLQPTNCFAAGRDFEQEQGSLKTLPPQQRRRFDLTLTILDGEADRAAFAARIQACQNTMNEEENK